MSLKDEVGNIIQNPKDIKDTTFNYFTKIYNTEHHSSMLNKIHITDSANVLTTREKDTIDSTLRLFEIKCALFSFKAMKAPGPNGLHPFFYQKPIGLCNTMYKLITKIIVNRIKPLLQNIIGPTQASFLANIRVVDNAIMVQEYITHFQNMKGKNANMILKVDLEKAFDRLEWSFIRESLIFFKFPIKLTTLIMSCLTTSSISILVNGTQTDYFKPSRDIRQWDPMSSYLFIVCMKRLSRDINNVVTDKDWFSISISKGGLFYLFFVDDLTMFARANRRNCETILAILGNFNVVSGQKAECATSCSAILGIKGDKDFGKYLGFPSSPEGLGIMTSNSS
uniref:Reverse transcriptase domain-containing protein n=1 Tax=Nicotiana tabacum TaxID=4097 RepID=A0A1S3XEC2_TOBAC|nr:PREDICTED: uncharacterized protein LOC107764104 [Nicotiana tabacum]